ncbi:Ig domain-containing protein [Histomonas meleagridis]|uniref:Ig domain-containing protein n=1 Tax=Histomonas meleagridis TaxID=135588 RepID=UPI00355A31DE|nr:Ig domain-containing protein [Histomonas meleagridis]KAH0802222.1 Ig domain-containing protein [Histomonas meleagridis]
MEGGTMKCFGVPKRNFKAFGKDPETGKQLISVTYVSVTEFGSDPSIIDDYDVVMFGSWDSNGCVSISTDSVENYVKPFIEKGGGVIIGHDILSKVFMELFSKPESLLALSKSHFGIEVYPKDTNRDLDATRIGFATIRKSGILTSYPWYIGDVGKILNIPTTHAYYQYSIGDVWLVLGPSVNEDWDRQRFYLSVYNNTATIQTGHSNGESTDEEQKIIANLIYYLKKKTEKTSFTDHSSNDDDAPIVNLHCKSNIYHLTWEGVDIGTKYRYKVQAFNNNNEKDPIGESDTEIGEVKTGINGFYYCIDGHKNTNIIGNEKIEIFTKETSHKIENFEEQKYFHIAAKDNAGNLGKTEHCYIQPLPTPSMSPLRTQEIGIIDNRELISNLSPTTQYMLIACGCIAIIGSIIGGFVLYRYFKKADDVLDQQIEFQSKQRREQVTQNYFNPLYDSKGEVDPFAVDFEK